MDRPKGFTGLLFDEGTRALSRVAGRVMQDPRAQELVARAVGIAQRGRQRFEKVEEQMLHAAGLAARPDYQEIAKRLARLKRQLREVSRKLDEEREVKKGQRPR